MNRAELIEALASKTSNSKAQTDRIIGTLIEIISGSLKRGDIVQLDGFGTIEVRNRNARKACNSATGETQVKCLHPKLAQD